MSERKFNEIFAERLKYYLEENEMSQRALAQKLDVGAATVSNWINAMKTPRMDKVDKMCEIFGCKRSDLIEEKPSSPAPSRLTLSPLEEQLVIGFRRADSVMQSAVLRILAVDVDEDVKTS